MIDLSSIKAPGWQRVVSDLSTPAPDDRTYMARLVTVLSQVSGARQGVLFMIAEAPSAPDETASGAPPIEGEARPIFVWPLPAGVASTIQSGQISERALLESPVDENSIDEIGEARSAARSAHAARQTRVFGLDKTDGLYESGPGKGYVVAVPIPGGAPGEQGAGGVRGVITLLLDGRSRQALQTTLALVEVLAGYIHGHSARQQLGRIRAAGAALDLAARLIAAINTAKTFKGATFQLVNDLCRQLSVDRVALGWVKRGRHTEGRLANMCLAVSDTENIDRRMSMIQKLEAAMDECLDQEQPVMYPLPAGLDGSGEVLLSQAITHAHRELAASDARLRVISIPMRAEGKVLGTLLIEATGTTPIDLGTIELLQAAMDLVTPVLDIRRSDDRNLALRAYDSSLRAGSWLVGPKHTAWKLAGLTLAGVLLASIFIRVPYRVSAPVEIQARSPRTVSIPFDGVVRSLGAGIETGARVTAGDVLVTLDTTDLELNALDAKAQIVQAETQADEAMKKGDLSQAQQQQAKADQSRAKLKLLEYRLSQATITAPITGVIIAGEVKDRVGSSVKLGDAIFQIADLNDMVVVARVDDRDISLIAPEMSGQIAPKSDPSLAFDFRVEKIVPLAQPEDGANAFVVRGAMTQTAPWFRPGMEGIAKFNTPERSLLGIVTRRIVDQLRLWLWW